LGLNLAKVRVVNFPGGRRPARPGDRFDCAGCGQHLVFGTDGFVADEQLRACESKCDWTLAFRLDAAVT
jgi:hypothetical protein